MRVLSKVRMSIGATGVAVVLIGLSGASAQALGQKTWNDCWGGYTGKSWESPINGAINALTVRSGGCGYVYVALNNFGVVKKGTPRSSDGISITTTYTAGANVPTGGSHMSRTNGGVVLT